ncbi:MAG: Mth938-like domain-containing protein [Gammaproteobacteria bacterium]|nr:Mth938-like domain-containing protein [Gammaproteobacteria bacterium]
MLRCMPLTEDIITSRYQITGYDDNAIIINETHYHDSLVFSAGSLHTPWAVSSVEDLHRDNLQVIFDLKPEVVLLGTGKQQRFPDPKILALFGQKGLGLEVMDNGALCRTFNILIAEGRSVVAGVILGH